MNSLLLASQKMTVHVRKAILLVCVCALLCWPAFGQLNYGRIFGAVTDQTGGVVAGAVVTVVDVARGINHPLTTDGAGEYSASSLLPGTYTVRAEAKGFKISERQNIAVAVGQDLRVDLTLQTGEQTQTVTVTESLPLIQTTNAQLGEEIENQVLNDLPLNGREFEKVMIYQPGVRANGLDISVNGNRTDNNGWLFDGIDDINHLSASGPIVGGQQNFDEATILPIDMIQEVNVVEQPKAEYGWKPSTAVSVGLKSGTNDMHGTAFASGRDTAMDAKNQFLANRVVDNLEQFGATVGGPIKKDKLFYFIGYEGQRYLVSSPRTVSTPTTSDILLGGKCAGGGDCSNSIPDAVYDIVKSGSQPSQLSLNLAGCNQTVAQIDTIVNATGSLPGQITCSSAAGLFPNSGASQAFPIALNNQGGSDNGLAKIDYHLNDHNSINGEFFRAYGNIVIGSGGLQPYWRAEDPTPAAELARGVWVWTPNSNLVNEARFGFDLLHNPQQPYEGLFPGSGPNYVTQFGLNTGLPMPGSPASDNVAPGCPQCGFPLVTIGTFAQLGAATGQKAIQNTYDGVDSVSWTRGKHIFKFGGEIHWTTFTGVGLETNGTGLVCFGSGSCGGGSVAAFANATPLEDFLSGSPSGAELLVGNVVVTTYYHRYALYAQDDWRVTPKLTANLGLRWEYLAPLGALNNALGNFAPSSTSGMVQQGVGGANSLYSTQKDAFAPRVGLAWDVTGKGKTVMRVGGALLYNTSIPLLSLMVQNAALPQVPTGFNLLTGNSTTVASPGNIAIGNVILGPQQVPWSVGTAVFNAVGPGSLYCGNGQFTVSVGGVTETPSSCTPFGIDPHFRTPYVVMWNLAVQQALTNDLSLTVAYVGTHGNLGGPFDVNQPTLGVGGNATSGPNMNVSNELLRRPYYNNFPYFSRIQVYEGRGESSDYNALQLSLQQRVSHGLSFSAGYSLDHCLSTGDAERGFGLMDSTDAKRDYGNCSIQPFNHFTFTATYAVPGHKAPAQLLEGWELNSVLDLVGGVPFNSNDSTSDLAGTGEGFERWTLAGPVTPFQNIIGGVGNIPCFAQPGVPAVVGVSPKINAGKFAGSPCITVAAGTSAAPWANMPAPCVAAASAEATNSNVPNQPVAANGAYPNLATGLEALATYGCYMVNGSAIVPPAQGTFGTMRRDMFQSKPVHEWDISISKQWKIKERLATQFKADFFNILNLANYSNPSSNPTNTSTYGVSQSTPSNANPIVGEFGPREIQLTLKFAF
jgi:hypothetical protein